MQTTRPNTAVGPGLLEQFKNSLAVPNVIERLRSGLIGNDAEIDGPFGPKPLVYADYVASGRALMQIEEFIFGKVLPYYANSHTEASYCGGFMTRLRREARTVIAQCCGASDQHAVIFTGSGATAGWRRNWSQVVPFFAYPESGRRIIYTTTAARMMRGQNPVHRRFR